MWYCVPTPYSLLNDEDSPRDVFAEIFPQYIDPDDPSAGEYPNWSAKRKALWAEYHDTGIGNLDVDYWVRCMKSQASRIEGRYAIKFRAWNEYLARLESAESIDLADSSMESRSVQKGYNPPNVQVSGVTAEDYLSDQNVNEFSQKTDGGLESETVRDYGDAVSNPFETYAEEFRTLFYRGY